MLDIEVNLNPGFRFKAIKLYLLKCRGGKSEQYYFPVNFNWEKFFNRMIYLLCFVFNVFIFCKFGMVDHFDQVSLEKGFNLKKLPD